MPPHCRATAGSTAVIWILHDGPSPVLRPHARMQFIKRIHPTSHACMRPLAREASPSVLPCLGAQNRLKCTQWRQTDGNGSYGQARSQPSPSWLSGMRPEPCPPLRQALVEIRPDSSPPNVNRPPLNLRHAERRLFPAPEASGRHQASTHLPQRLPRSSLLPHRVIAAHNGNWPNYTNAAQLSACRHPTCIRHWTRSHGFAANR